MSVRGGEDETGFISSSNRKSETPLLFKDNAADKIIVKHKTTDIENTHHFYYLCLAITLKKRRYKLCSLPWMSDDVKKVDVDNDGKINNAKLRIANLI